MMNRIALIDVFSATYLRTDNEIATIWITELVERTMIGIKKLHPRRLQSIISIKQMISYLIGRKRI